MRFIDSAKIVVFAGNGGNGCVSFQKKGGTRYLGKPDGSNGGDGGDVCLLSDCNLNTLDYFRYNRIFRATNGSRGYSKNCTGKRGKDLVIRVPRGTRVCCQDTSQILGDMMDDNSLIIVAKGGRFGLGNSNFKKYYSQYNKKKMSVFQLNSRVRGTQGENRRLLLDLVLIADVGLFGLPNSGKSSFLNIVSKATPKIANYPFTTLVPNLGVVKINEYNDQFVIADIPGIIKGAATGLGLGIKFLKHLERCRMLLHFVDIKPMDHSNPIENILAAERELLNFNIKLTFKTRWLVFNKIDLLSTSKIERKINHIIRSISWNSSYYAISVIDNKNIEHLCHDIAQFIMSNNT